MSERILRARSAVVVVDGRQVTYMKGDTVADSIVGELEAQGALERSPAPGTVPDTGTQPETAPPAGGYDDLTVDELQALADERGLQVEGTGSGGNVVKADLVAALEAGDTE